MLEGAYMKHKLDGFTLKLIAIAAMTVDHIAVIFFPTELWMRLIGRLTMPIMAFFIAEGYKYTRSVKRYVSRILLFAAISQIPFMLAFNSTSFNVMFTLTIAILIVLIEQSRLPKHLRLLLSLSLLCLSIFCDWPLFGVLYVLVFFRYRGNFKRQAIAFTFTVLVQLFSYSLTSIASKDYSFIVEAGTLGALPLLSLYSGKKGEGPRYLFYIFYPAHLAVLALLGYLI